MLDLQQMLIDNLEYRVTKPPKLSVYLSKLILPGQEDRFWSPDEKIVVVDTSFFAQGYFQNNLWGEIANNLMHDIGVTPVVLPIVASELLHLKTAKTRDSYDMIVVDDSIDMDLLPRNLRLGLTVDDELSDRIINMWKSTSQKYRRYLSLKSAQATNEQYIPELPESIEPLIEPTLSRADIEIMRVALLRAATGLPTMVLSGDADITRTMSAFKHTGYPLEVYGPSPPTESMLSSFIKDMEILLTAEVTQKINSAEPNKQYLLISKNEPIVGNQKRDLGFMVADEPINNESIYSAPIVDPNDTEFDNIYSEFRLVAVPSEQSSTPYLVKRGTMIYSARKHAFKDSTRLYKDLNVQKALTDHNVPKGEHGQYYQRFMKGHAILVVNVPVKYCRMTDSYMAVNLPNLFSRVQELKLSVQK
jgi:hypothetical protein|tara:strand:+ start:177 stop:1430 length:1254 start_codon:yes stop_codon:yes gene_type:complete